MDFVGIGEATKMLGLSRTSIQKLVDSGKLPAVKTNGGHRRILRSSIEALNQKMGHKAMLRLASSQPGSLQRMPGLDADQEQIHVLVVEDDEPTASLLVALFETHYPDIKYTLASDGLDAVLQLERMRPRILITDLSMEPFDGFRLLNMVFSRTEYQGISTIVISGLSETEIQKRGGLPPEVLFLPKPISIERLRGFLDAHVQIHRQYRALA
jgi:excisionase family DNA binding protein